MKTMLIGGTDGIGKQIAERFDADVYSGKHGGYNIDHQQDRQEIAEESLAYDICVVHTHVVGSDAQSRLVSRIAQAWEQNEKGGYIFVTGSSISYRQPKRNDYNTIRYISTKAQLDAMVKQISLRYEEGQTKFRITNIRPGFLDTPKSRAKDYFTEGITGDEYCDIIEYLINSPKRLIINEMVVNARRNQ
jgi:NAD(P)-dependent dehydrogenase (short-subunit alcohol dehydrogenase family)